MSSPGLLFLALAIFPAACSSPAGEDDRGGGLQALSLDLTGSLQNPAWSPEGDRLLFTRFRNGYNEEPADLLMVDLHSYDVRTLVADGSGNVNLPGSAWSAATEQIVFASTRDPHDEIYAIGAAGEPGDERRVTFRDGLVAYEPSFSPDGEWIVFESHVLDVEENGVIVKCRADGTGGYTALTDSSGDCRQPNWAPQGNRIVYQCFAGGRWDLWIMKPDGTDRRQITSGTGDKTDASSSPDGKWIVYSSDEPGLAFAGLFVVSANGGTPTRVMTGDGYAGAPSWSPDGTRIAFETSPGDPDESSGTTLCLVDAPWKAETAP